MLHLPFPGSERFEDARTEADQAQVQKREVHGSGKNKVLSSEEKQQ